MNVFLGGGVTHHNIILHTTELANALYAAVDARDLPGMADVDSSLLLFCREIKKHATVALSGECADEIFGGYPWYRDPEVRAVDGFPWAQSTAYRATFLNEEFIGTNPTDLANAFVDNRYRQTLTDTDILPGLNAEERRLRQMTRLNFDWFMQTLLDRKDRMSMYSGLEVRVPFCDHRIAEYLYSVPWEFKDLQGREKGLLREALKGLLPDEVLWRKKSPYPKTHNPSYLRLVSERLGYVIADPSAPLLHIVSKSALTALLNGESSQSVPWYGQLMTRPQTIAYFLQLNYWLEKYNVKIV
jgi:asparagine synthase (glutamine-hydrolysing)